MWRETANSSLDFAAAGGQFPRMNVLAHFRRAVRIAAFAIAGFAVLFAVLLVAWRFVPPVSTPMVARWVTGQRVERIWRPIESVDRDLIVAVIASEDTGFCRHHGIDWEELIDVIDDEDGPKRGGSTLTMQVTKNLFLWSGRSYVRKAIEIPMAMIVDLVWPKTRIFEIYLNVAEWGPDGEFGIEAGARRAFGHGADRISAREAAYLAVTLPNPIRRNPAKPSPGLRRVAGIIAARAANSPEVADCIGR
jgi:monofunctional biosynthetic peptidoglycan transglycosylase